MPVRIVSMMTSGEARARAITENDGFLNVEEQFEGLV